MNWTDKIEVFNSDCLEAMKGMEDNQFDLALVDPPYGLGERLTAGGDTAKFKFKHDPHILKWDVKPPAEYFKQLFRISKNQIIWGGNYFDLPINRCFLIWDKFQRLDNFSHCE